MPHHSPKKRIISLFFCLIGLASVSFTLAKQPDLAKQIHPLLNPCKKTQFSIQFCDAQTEEILFSYNAKKPLIPASNMKLVTTAAAIHCLGPDFTFQTRFVLWQNNLVILGAGDPLLGDPRLAERRGSDIFEIFQILLHTLQQKGITKITGDLLIDDTLFDDTRFHPSWPIDQENRWYAAQVSALNFNDNCVDLLFKPTAPGTPCLFELQPDTKYLDITNNCNTVSTADSAFGASRKHDTNEVTFFGRCRHPNEKPIYVAVDRPSAFFGFVLAEYLLKHGIAIEGKLIVAPVPFARQKETPADVQLLFIWQTPITEVLTACNTRSLNLAAECLFKTTGAYDCDQPESPRTPLRQGSWPAGRKAIENFLTKLQISPAQYRIDDGCGLSHENRLSAHTLTRILSYMYRSRNCDIYKESLATPDTGTLAKRNRFNDPSYQDRIYAKTGYVNDVRSLSGYCQTASGRWLAFSILTNSPPAPGAIMDQIVQKIIDFTP